MSNEEEATTRGKQQLRIKFFQPSYMETAGASSLPWENWSRLLRRFVIVSAHVADNDELRFAILYGSLGTEGARVASDLTDDSTDFDETMRRLTERFG